MSSDFTTHPFVVLKQEEIEKPDLVFDRLFEYAHFSDLRNSLEEIKRWLINKDYPHSNDQFELENTAYFFRSSRA